LKTRSAPESTSKSTLSHTRLRRAVASSTAIETGQPVKTIETLLKTKKSKFQNLQLAR